MKKDLDYDYFYDGGDKTYCYPNSNVLVNKLDIQDIELLRQAERDLSEQRMFALDFSLTSSEEMASASITSFTCDYSMMESVIEKCIIDGKY